MQSMATAKAKGASQPIELFSGTYFGACALGGVVGKRHPKHSRKSGKKEDEQDHKDGRSVIETDTTPNESNSTLIENPSAACGPTHSSVTPLDLVRVSHSFLDRCLPSRRSRSHRRITSLLFCR